MKVRYSGNQTEYLEGFPEGCQRSCKGAIHLHPGSTKNITEDEYAFVKGAYPHVKLEVLKEHKSVEVKSQDKSEQKEVKASEEKSLSEESEEASSEATDASEKSSKRKAKVKAK